MANVLIVDDDRDLAEALAEVLGWEGYETRIARDGQEGLDRVYERKPDLIVLDVEMPTLDGPALARRLEAVDANQTRTPIILVSGIPRLAALAADAVLSTQAIHDGSSSPGGEDGPRLVRWSSRILTASGFALSRTVEKSSASRLVWSKGEQAPLADSPGSRSRLAA